MASPLWQELLRIGFYGVDTGYVGGGRGGGGTNRGRGGLPSAQNVHITLVAVDTFLVTWTDWPPTMSTNASQFYWRITYASKDIVGSQGGVTSWSEYVYNRSTGVATIQSNFSGREIGASFYLPGATDGYVQVTGYSMDGGYSRPSLPILLNSNGSLGRIPGNVLTASIAVSKERVPYDVLRLDATYTPPADTGMDYAGCHIHMLGYNLGVDYEEIGAMDQWDHSTGNQYATYRLPVETGQGSGTATFANGSGTVNRVSGTNFAVGWVGRKFVVDTSATTSQVYQVSGWTSINVLTITPTFSGTNGTYAWKALSTVQFYFVSIGTSGARIGDVTTAPLVTI